MSDHLRATASTPADTIASNPRVRSIARRFGHQVGRRNPVSIETDAKLQAAHVRAAGIPPELY